MDLVDLIASRQFLGGEFLVWLWYQGETRDGRFDLPGFGSTLVTFDDQLVLEAFLAESEQSRLTGGAPTRSEEAKSALRAGKRVSKAKLRLLHNEMEWLFTVSAADFSFTSVSVPAVLKKEDERLLERASLLDDLSAIWHSLYRTFLMERLGDAWETTCQDIALWAHKQA